ncbi:uncharacterized protein LOC105197467 [Solenopsis invicta]|uniref:uncharacterized protein LOC105197467 n=1 Tax=Solenopsis invicta TaxID=13686 RepID=UPI00193CD7FF|nr:uncharacterized protein LOC105197467 [Solenopsis invicta]
MNALWNLHDLKRPPCSTWQIKPLEATKKGLEVSRFKIALGTAINDMESEWFRGFMLLEFAILNRLMYRMATKFRHDQGLNHMWMMRSALRKIRGMALEKEYTNLRSDLRMRDGMHILPSRQRLEYMLLRLQGFGKLMLRIRDVSRTTAYFWLSRIKSGQAWTVATIANSLASRIWLLAKYTIIRCCVWYNELYQCAKQFQYVGTQIWLSKNLTLPEDLKSWLNFNLQDREMMCNPDPQIWLLETEVDNKSTTCNKSDEKTDNSRLTQGASSNNELNLFDLKFQDTSISNNDIGEIVDREDFEKKFSKAIKLERKKGTMKRKHADTTDASKRRDSKKKKKNVYNKK